VCRTSISVGATSLFAGPEILVVDDHAEAGGPAVHLILQLLKTKEPETQCEEFIFSISGALRSTFHC